MLLSDVLEEIREKSGTNLTNRSLIRKVNQVQNQIFRRFKRRITTNSLDLIANEALYPLPCPSDMVTQILVNGTTFDYGRLEGNNKAFFYYYLDGSIGIYPEPTEDGAGGLLVFHYVYPTQLTVNDLDKEPDLDSDYHMLLVYGVLIDVADQRDRSEYKLKYDELLLDYSNADEEPEFPQIEAVYSIDGC